MGCSVKSRRLPTFKCPLASLGPEKTAEEKSGFGGLGTVGKCENPHLKTCRGFRCASSHTKSTAGFQVRMITTIIIIKSNGNINKRCGKMTPFDDKVSDTPFPTMMLGMPNGARGGCTDLHGGFPAAAATA